MRACGIRTGRCRCSKGGQRLPVRKGHRQPLRLGSACWLEGPGPRGAAQASSSSADRAASRVLPEGLEQLVDHATRQVVRRAVSAKAVINACQSRSSTASNGSHPCSCSNSTSEPWIPAAARQPSSIRRCSAGIRAPGPRRPPSPARTAAPSPRAATPPTPAAPAPRCSRSRRSSCCDSSTCEDDITEFAALDMRVLGCRRTAENSDVGLARSCATLCADADDDR